MLASHTEMMSDTLGFERFWGLTCVDDCNVIILKVVKKNEFELRHWIVANMKGKYSGVQNKILDHNTWTSFVPYGCHNGNGAVCHGEVVCQSCNLVGLLGRLCHLFATSVNHRKIFNSACLFFHLKVTERNAL